MKSLLPLLLLAVFVFIIHADGQDVPEVQEGRLSYCRACCIEHLNRSAYCRNARRKCQCYRPPPRECSGSCGSGGKCKRWCHTSEEQVSGSCSGYRCKCCKPKTKPCPRYGSSCGISGTWKNSCSSTEVLGAESPADFVCSGSRYCCCKPKTTVTYSCSDRCVSSSRCRPPIGFPYPSGGSCPSGKTCCVIDPMCGDHLCRDVKGDEKED